MLIFSHQPEAPTDTTEVLTRLTSVTELLLYLPTQMNLVFNCYENILKKISMAKIPTKTPNISMDLH